MTSSRPLHICLVCTGNTCRSPMSEGILRAIVRREGLSNWQVESGGLSALVGAPASAGSIQAALEDGVDIRSHRASLFTPERAARCDLILVHSGEHYHQVLTWGDQFAAKTFLIKHFPTTGDPGPSSWVADPIGLELPAYRETYLELKSELNRIVSAIRDWAGKAKV